MANPSQSLEFDTPYQEMEVQRSEHRTANGTGYKAVIAYGWDGTQPVPLGGGFVPDAYDSIFPTFNSTSDVYVYKLSGATVRTITITYTDSTKGTIQSIVRS